MNHATQEHIEGVIDLTDDILSDLDMSAIEETDEEILSGIGTLTADDDAAVDILVERSEILAEQTADIVVADATPTPTSKPKKVKAAAGPKAPKDLESIDPQMFVLDNIGRGETALLANKQAVIDSRPAQKKIGEKFDNLFQALSIGKKPSTYTMQVFGVLEAKGTATSTEIVAALKATNSRSGAAYDQGTAMSQVGQMMVLFNTVGIAARVGNTLTIDRESPMTKKLAALTA